MIRAEVSEGSVACLRVCMPGDVPVPLRPECNAAGTIALSGKLAELLEALYNGRIPREWLSQSWGASTLGTWFTGLLARHDQLQRWLHSGRPKAYWLTGFFNPQARPQENPNIPAHRSQSSPSQALLSFAGPETTPSNCAALFLVIP